MTNDSFDASSPKPTVCLQFQRAWVEDQDVDPALAMLLPLIVCRKSAEHHAGTVLLFF